VQGRKVLVIDDDPEFRTNVVGVLAHSGIEAVAAEEVAAALRLLAQGGYDVVLLDLIMPRVGGMEALSQIKGRWPSIRVILVTAFATVENAVEAIRKGADDYIEKPFKIAELVTKVRRNLEEAKFTGRDPGAVDIDVAFSCLSNVIRREVLLWIRQQGRVRFMDLSRKLEFDDHTKLNFHLKILKEAGLIAQAEGKEYTLTAQGSRVAACLELVSRNLQPPTP
jgi:DNA-binding response OmpR family regulator